MGCTWVPILKKSQLRLYVIKKKLIYVMNFK